MEHSQLFIIVAAIVALDIVSGLMVAAGNQAIQSSKLRSGLLKKGGYVVAIALALVLETGADLELGINFPGVAVVCAAIVAIDAISICENLCILNPDLLDSPIGTWLAQNKKVKAAQEAASEGTDEGNDTPSGEVTA